MNMVSLGNEETEFIVMQDIYQREDKDTIHLHILQCLSKNSRSMATCTNYLIDNLQMEEITRLS